MPPVPPIAAYAGLGVAVLGVVHLAVARRADLGGAVVALAGAVAVLGAPGDVAWLLAGLVASWVGAWRGARAGAGRPELVMTAVVGAVGAHVGLEAFPSPGPEARAGLAAALVALGAVLAVLAAERPGVIGLRVHHHREVPVRGGDST
jgi:hypothetical protein